MSSSSCVQLFCGSQSSVRVAELKRHGVVQNLRRLHASELDALVVNVSQIGHQERGLVILHPIQVVRDVSEIFNLILVFHQDSVRPAGINLIVLAVTEDVQVDV